MINNNIIFIGDIVKLKTIKIISVIGIFLLSFLAHFVYDFFPNVLSSIFFPVNESIWEHMKILFTSIIIYGIIDYILLKKNNIYFNNFKAQLFFTAFISIPIYLIIFLPIYNLIGENLFVSISIMFIVYVIISYISYKMLLSDDFKLLNNISVYLIIIMYFIFTYLTYFPYDDYIFYDTNEKKYGINGYKEKI